MTGKKYRLPTEEEWEYAARGGNKSRGYLYSGDRKIDDVAWYDKNSGKKTHPVGTKQPNELGIHDMNGNVYEWVEDYYYERSSENSARVVRGGGWNDNNEQCYVFNRNGLNPASHITALGLRLAHDIDSGRGMVPLSEKETSQSAEKESAKDNGVYEEDGYRHLDPRYFSAGTTTIQWIFPVPEPNAIGTLDKENNGITFINFNDYAPGNGFRVVAKDYIEKIYGLFYYRFSTNYTNEMIAYSQDRIAVIANIKTNDAFYVRCSLSYGDLLLGIRFLDLQKKLFVIVKSIDEGDDWREDYLYVVKLEEQKFADTDWRVHIGQTFHVMRGAPLYYKWFVHDRKLFAYNEDGKILCTDDGYQDVPHPFSEVFNAHADGIGNVQDIAINPTQPFGVAIEDRAAGGKIIHQIRIVRWDVKKPEEQLVSFNTVFEPLAELLNLERTALAYQSFSPDGNWYVLGFLEREAALSTIKPKHPFFIAIPVDKGQPGFLGLDKLIILGQVSNMTSIAWTSGPTAYVVSNGKRLRKWDLPDR
jgi:hypothetical protein